MFKTANVGSADRIARIVVGVLLILAPYLMALAAPWSWLLPVVGVVLVVTAIVRFCPLYRLIGVNTCKI